MSKYKNPVCRGSWALGTACGTCERCLETKPGTEARYNEREDLHQWFGLSYASWLTLPRVLMQAMPDDWQKQMAELLNQYNDAYPNQPDLGTRVQMVMDGKLVKTPDYLINYRRPDREKIDEMRGSDSGTKENDHG